VRIAAAVAAIAAVGVLATGVAEGSAQAGTSVNWKSRTCSAAKAWEGHRTTARFNTMVIDSLSAPAKYLGSDVLELAADVRGGAAAKYIKQDIAYVNDDCEG
jgi:hypothetical protein